MGNLNIDLLQIGKNQNSRNYANSLINFSCKCLIDISTRVTMELAALLDHVYTSLLDNFIVSGVLSQISRTSIQFFSAIMNSMNNNKSDKFLKIREILQPLMKSSSMKC